MAPPKATGPARGPFRIDWVLRDELAVGPAPAAPHHLEQLRGEGVQALLSLCSQQEWPWPHDLERRFACRRCELPDHRSGRHPSPGELGEALGQLASLRRQGLVVYAHCLAGVERSPLLCMAWMMRERGLNRLQALDYLMQVHPGTSPLAGQLNALDAFAVSLR
ncbi:dual specificity protein phosphatase family protein [Cyanobium sp. ATX 6A2]|uniref:protein-tyrosine phosphatase family protein n=1 Tax=Cyanobium sp. ATX 6A2 TaxID=2823700 RepID=UPI0020CDB7F9|nr:dual specificity protein phosphatase [Cyanobium sp. ATX 6A2]MCP9888951.1 dual specificity protein phosphatase family protein [Cyanobium sp. ATX 6A2]